MGSGKAKECDGEICLHLGVRPSGLNSKSIQGEGDGRGFTSTSIAQTRKKSLLYKINQDGVGRGMGGLSGLPVKVWVRGTDRGFL